jgi:hypothetical protein
MNPWSGIYKELSIFGQRRRKRVPTEATIATFERAHELALPKSYREFSVLFGAGELCGFYRFHVPLDRKDEYDLSTYNVGLQGEQRKDHWAEYGQSEIVGHLLFFCSTIGGEFYAWRTNEITNQHDHEYAVYHFLRSPSLEKVAQTFQEFFEKCRTGVLGAFSEPLQQSYLKY